MKKEKRIKTRGLSLLYLNFIFQKTTWIVFILSLILMCIGIYFASNPWMLQSDYLLAPEGFHLYYSTQALIILQIFNSIILSSIIICTVIHSIQFDSLFVSYIPRRSICINKFIAIVIVCFFLCFFEMILFTGVAMLQYSKYIVTPELLYSFGYLFLSVMFEAILSMVATTFLPIVFVPMLVLFISIILKMLCNNYSQAQDALSGFIPILSISPNTNYICMQNAWVSVIWIILLVILLNSMYNIKDL